MKPELIAVERGQAEYRLTENHPLRVAHAAGQRIECLQGTAWITAYGEHTDFMLREGQSFEVPNDGLMLIDAAGAGATTVRLRLDADTVDGWQAFQRKVGHALSHPVGFLLRN